MTTMVIAERISEAKSLGRWLHERTNGKRFPGGARERTGLAILQLTEDIVDAITELLNANLPGPALSLARPLLEGYVRGYWLLNCATDKHIIEFNNGKCPDFPNLLAAIPKDAESGGAWIHANVAQNLSSFHDLTHGGSEHVKRRINEGTVEPSYPEQESRSLLKLGNEIRIRIGVELLGRLNDEVGLAQLRQRTPVLRSES